MRLPLPTASVVALCAVLALFAGCGGGDDEKTEPGVPPVPNPPGGAVKDTHLRALGDKGPLIGLADNRPETMTDPAFEKTGVKRVRVAVPYDDVARGGTQRATQDAWFKTARKAGVEPVVSFYRSSKSISLLPSVDEFRRDFQAFHKRYPWVKIFSTWNEANFRPQPTSKNPLRTAAYYRVLRKECAGGECIVLACDFRPDGTTKSARWLARFENAIGPGPHRWGLAPYVDVNRRSTQLTRVFLRRTSGPVWVNEVGAINFFGRGVKPNVTRQGRDMHYLLTRYAKVSPRLERIYVYNWRAAPGDTLFDSGLRDESNAPRPAFREFARAIDSGS